MGSTVDGLADPQTPKKLAAIVGEKIDYQDP